jgi:pimeloyl-ACP methyl ester carboxylesterase
MQAIDHRTIMLPSGVRLDYAECGKGPATLFLHGYTDSWRSFEPVLTRMSGDVRSLGFSQRGHGDSSPSRP